MIGNRIFYLYLNTFVLNEHNKNNVEIHVKALKEFAEYYISVNLMKKIKSKNIYELQNKYKDYFNEALNIFWHMDDEYIHWDCYDLDLIIDDFVSRTDILDWNFSKEDLRTFINSDIETFNDRHREIINKLKECVQKKKAIAVEEEIKFKKNKS